MDAYQEMENNASDTTSDEATNSTESQMRLLRHSLDRILIMRKVSSRQNIECFNELKKKKMRSIGI